MTTHRYETELRWSGSTRDHATYDRRHEVRLGAAWHDLSADPAFLGDAELSNPEQLLVAAASSCQMLSFLAVASRSGVEVLRYDDRAEGTMPEDDPPVRLTRIVLRPRILVRGATAERVERLVTRAHGACFVAHSLTSELVLAPQVEVAA